MFDNHQDRERDRTSNKPATSWASMASMQTMIGPSLKGIGAWKLNGAVAEKITPQSTQRGFFLKGCHKWLRRK